MEVFFDRIRSAVKSAIKVQDTCVIVGTRSVGVALANMVSGMDRFDSSCYRRHLFDPGSTTIYEVDEGFTYFNLVVNNDTAYLNVSDEYRDK